MQLLIFELGRFESVLEVTVVSSLVKLYFNKNKYWPYLVHTALRQMHSHSPPFGQHCPLCVAMSTPRLLTAKPSTENDHRDPDVMRDADRDT